MRHYSIGSRYISLLLLVAMLFSLLPVLPLETSAKEVTDTPTFMTAAEDGVTMLNNGNNISMSIKVNNFGMDGMLFDYLSSWKGADNNPGDSNATDYLWERLNGNKLGAIQLYPFNTRYDLSCTHSFADKDGFSDRINRDKSLDASSASTNDNYGYLEDGVTQVTRTLTPEVYTGSDTYVYAASQVSNEDTTTPYVRLFPTKSKGGYSYSKGRAWAKLTTFTNTEKVEDIRYVAIVYRLPNGASSVSNYATFGLTINNMMETNGNCSRYVSVDTKGGTQWQYAIIDLMGLGGSDTRRIASGTEVNEVYLQTPLNWNENSDSYSIYGAGTTRKVMDIAAVGYFPYYGDAEQFAYYGLTLGCQQKYFGDDNAGFSLRNNSRTYTVKNNKGTSLVQVKSLPTFYDIGDFDGARPFGVNTLDDSHAETDYWQVLQDIKDELGAAYDENKLEWDVMETTGNMLFGRLRGQASLGMIETELGETGQPVYKESVVHYVAAYLRNQLLTIPEYPSDNNGWRNYSYMTGTSTTGGSDEALFGKNELGQSIDLATALCDAIGVKKGAAITGGLGNFGNAGYYDYSVIEDNCHYGSYAKTIAHKDELLGTWDQCKDNIKTWHDAAWYLLHNLYVSDADIDDKMVDGYGEYESDFRVLTMPQVQYTQDGVTSTPYFFDSGYAYYEDKNDENTWSSAVNYNRDTHTISLNGDADGVALFESRLTSGQNPSCWFPFLPTSGNNPAGESNTPYYLHDGAFGRKPIGTTYRDRDFSYALSGEGYFAYEPDLYFNFQGDDDVYVFINGQLVIDIGGTHGATIYEMRLDDYVEWAESVKSGKQTYKGKTYSQLSGADKRRVDGLCLVTGGIYSFDFFYMERHGVGSNLRIMTNMKLVESKLDVGKHAWQNGSSLMDNGLFDADQVVEYGFSITNNSDGKLYNLSFVDDIIGVRMDPDQGLVVTGDVTDALGAPLSPAGLQITVDGFDANGNQLDTIHVSCPTNESLKQFLAILSAEGTQGGNVEEDFHLPYEGTGLWKDATVTVRGIYYELTEAQKEVSRFSNKVVGSGFMKAAGENGAIEDQVLWGNADHALYQPGQPYYYQWAGHPVVIESERLYQDILDGNLVASPAELPDIRDMILIPSNAEGTEVSSADFSNVPGGDVYLKINYQTPGSYMAYVTVRDASDEEFSLTVPVTIYVLEAEDSTVVLDYGLDSYLTEEDAIFSQEISGIAKHDVTGSVLGIAQENITPSYQEYNADSSVEQAAGQIRNDLTLVKGTYNSSTGALTGASYKLDKPIFLDHNKPWVLEWRSKFDNALMFSTESASNVDGNAYVYAASGNTHGLYIGEYKKEHFDVKAGEDAVSYNNYGIQNSVLDASTVKTYALVNQPDGAGGNTVYLYVDGVAIGPMNQYHYQNTAWDEDLAGNATNDSWLNGRDLTFNYLGTSNSSHTLDGAFEFIRVYEEGYHLAHYGWQMPTGNTAVNKVLNSVDSGNTGFISNGTTYKEYTITTSGNHKNYWTLERPVTLAHDENWQVTMTLEDIDQATVLLSAQASSQTNATHIYFYPLNGHQMVHMGYRNPRSEGSHTNYGLNVLDVIPGFSMADRHTYVLKNVVQPTGQNMVYLYIDGQEIGSLNNRYSGSYELLEENTDGISGLDFTFYNVGADADLKFGLMDYAIIHDLQIQARPALSNSYEWVPTGSGMVSTVATDNTGNQILFDREDTGIVTSGDGTFTLDGKGLKFSVNDIMDDRYTTYVAMAIHDKDFAPTALDVDGIDIRYEAQMYKKVTVLPANVVYYEDDFPAIHYYGSSVGSFTQLGNVSASSTVYTDTKYYAQGSSDGLTQSPAQDTPYGSDGAYRNIFNNASADTLHTVAINNDGPLAWFGFKGTGFELDARTSATEAGMVFVEIYNKNDVTFGTDGNPTMKDGFVDATPVNIIPVLPQFDIGNTVNGSFQMENGGSEAIYQVPMITVDVQQIIKTQDDPETTDVDETEYYGYGDYIVVISGVENLNYDDNNAHMDSYLFLDGIRIYNPLGTDVPEYGDEQAVIFEEIRQQILDGHILVSDYDETAGVSVGTALMTWTEKYDERDYTGKPGYIGNAVSDVNDYLIDGPNNEVYLDGTFTNGALVMYVRQSGGTSPLLQIGVRALDAGLYYGAGSTGMRANLLMGVMGTTATGTTEPGWHYLDTVATGTEQYYTVPYTLAPVVTIDGELYHQVVLKVEAFDVNTPAMLSFTSLKRTESLSICESQFLAADKVDINGSPVMESGTGYMLMNKLANQMSAYRSFTVNESAPGAEFEVDDTVVDETAPAIIPSYPTLAFEGEVMYNIYFQTANLEGVENMGLITFNSQLADGTVAEAAEVIPGALFNGTHYMVHSNGIPAKNLGDTLYFKVYAQLSDGSYIYSDLLSYSALEYAEYALTQTDDVKLKSLVVAMLNYGAEAQKLFSYRTDALMSNMLTAEQNTLVSAYSETMATPLVAFDSAKAGQFVSNGGFANKQIAVSFTGAFSLDYALTPDRAVDGNVTMYYWDAETYNGVAQLTAENATGRILMAPTATGEYVASYTGMAAKDIGDTVYAAVVYEAEGTTWCSGVVAYSIDYYCARQYAANASEMKELAAATTVYGYYAKNYFAN